MSKCFNKTVEHVDKFGDALKIMSMALFLMFPASLFPRADGSAAENNPVIKGIVIGSDNNKPLPGVSIYVEGTTIGTESDLKGQYELELPAGTEKVIFQMIGYEKKELNVNEPVLFTLVTMIEQENVLDEFVVVGFGVQKKESLVGAVQAVDPGDLKTSSSNLTTSFAGNIPGIIARQTSGEPGSDAASFYIRGVSTFGASTTPLMILDGVEITSTMLNNIAPETIESFSVLKDATATSLYGSRGANGVIIINTKEGRRSEKMNVNIRFENTFSMPTHVQEVADGVTYMELYNEALRNGGTEAYYSQEKIDGTRLGLNPYIFPDNDWYNMLFKDFTTNQNLNINVRGGTERISYYLNAGIFYENGIIKQPKENVLDVGVRNRKYLFQSNVSSNITKTTKVALKMNTQLSYKHTPYESVDNLFYYTMRANRVKFPAVLPGEAGDTFVRYGNNTSWDTGYIDHNPYALLSRGYSDVYYSYLTAAFSLDQDLAFITNGLKLSGLASFYNYTYAATSRYMTPFYFKVDDDYTVDEDGNYNFTTSSIGDSGSTFLSSSVTDSGNRVWSLQSTLDYNRAFGKHDVGATLVYHMKEKYNNATSSTETELLPYREQGVAGRLTYNFDHRYLLEGAFGYNGSENFMEGRRFGFFPSIAAGWIVSNEKFFKPLNKFINNLKVRASYGLVGNDYLSDRFPYITEVTMSHSIGWYKGQNFTNATGPTIATYGNEYATWEESKKLNWGVDLDILEQLNFTVDYFTEKRTGIFMQRQTIPSSVGLTNSVPYANIGEVDNEGLDLAVSWDKKLNKDWNIQLRGTLTYAHNEITERDEPSNVEDYYSEIGQPINSIRGLIAEGLFTSQEEIDNHATQTFSTYTIGDIKYKDLNGDGSIDGNDITTIGNPKVPEIVYGFGGTFKYRNWDLSLFFQGSSKVSLLMSDMHPFCDSSHFGYGITQYIADDHWSEDNNVSDAAYPRLSAVVVNNNRQTSSYWVRDASFLRLKSAEIGYNFSKFRIYLSGTNLLNFASFKHWDAEKGSGNGLSYPLQRTVKIGVLFQY